jgi:uncharacterized protein (TIGR00106 family)
MSTQAPLHIARMEIAVYPLGTAGPSVSREVSAVFAVLDASGLRYRVGEMGTTVEGTPEELFTLAARLHNSLFGELVSRVVTVLKLDERRDAPATPAGR